MGEIERAENKARQRATLFYMMALVLVVMTVVNLGRPTDGVRLAVWMVTMALFALNLTPVAPMRSRALGRLLNDETTRDHRRSSFAAGFWAAIASALAIGFATRVAAIAPLDVTRVVVAAGLTAALVSFATLELRAQGSGGR